MSEMVKQLTKAINQIIFDIQWEQLPRDYEKQWPLAFKKNIYFLITCILLKVCL